MLGRVVRLAAALSGAVLLSQFPAFYDQYVQRLGGRLDQARIEVARIERAALAERMDLDAYIQVFLTSERSPVRRHGQVMRTQIADLRRLEAAYVALRSAPTAMRPVRFSRHAEPELTRAAIDDFAPALPLGTEGLTYALIGWLAGLLGAWGAGRGALALVWRRRRA